MKVPNVNLEKLQKAVEKTAEISGKVGNTVATKASTGQIAGNITFAAVVVLVVAAFVKPELIVLFAALACLQMIAKFVKLLKEGQDRKKAEQEQAVQTPVAAEQEVKVEAVKANEKK